MAMTTEEYIQQCKKKVDEMETRDKTGMSFVDVMKPSQDLYNALIMRMNELMYLDENKEIEKGSI